MGIYSILGGHKMFEAIVNDLISMISTIKVVVTLLGGLAALSFVIFSGKKLRDYYLAEVYKIFQIAVNKAYENYVKWWKAASADGKVSKEERRKEEEFATIFALDLSSGICRLIIKSMNFDSVSNVIKKIIRLQKGEANGHS